MQEHKLEDYNHQKIYHLVEAQAKRNPAKIAIKFYQQTLTYKELNSKANQFACYLINNGVNPGDIIPIISKNTPTILVAILGILKAVADYSPLNPVNIFKRIYV